MKSDKVIVDESALSAAADSAARYSQNLRDALTGACEAIESLRSEWDDEDFEHLTESLHYFSLLYDGVEEETNNLCADAKEKIEAIRRLRNLKI